MQRQRPEKPERPRGHLQENQQVFCTTELTEYINNNRCTAPNSREYNLKLKHSFSVTKKKKRNKKDIETMFPHKHVIANTLYISHIVALRFI